MADWIYSKNGQATIILDKDCFRSNHGQVIAWVKGEHIYSLNGQHVGWFEGVVYDSNNKALGFIRNCTGYLPSRPGIGGSPGIPGFGGRPGRPGFSGVPGKPGRGGWSQSDLSTYFNT